MDLDPRVKRFQEIKRRNKAAAIIRKAAEEKKAAEIAKIRAVSPTLSDTQALQVYEAAERHKQARTINLNGKVIKVFQA